MAQVVEPSKYKALGSNPSTGRKKTKQNKKGSRKGRRI
jgi:hypothetical protein